VDVALVEEADVADGAIVEGESLHAVLLDGEGLVLDATGGVGYLVLQEALPLAVGEAVIVEALQLAAQVIDELLFAVDVETLEALTGELGDEFLLQFGFGLVGGVAHRGRSLVVGDYGRFGVLRKDVELLGHIYTVFLLKVRSFSR